MQPKINKINKFVKTKKEEAAQVATLLTANAPFFFFLVCVIAVPKLVSTFALLQLTVYTKIWSKSCL